MRLVFNARGLAALAQAGALPCVAQQFLNHGGRLFKVFTLGDAHHCRERSSICDLCPVPDPGPVSSPGATLTCACARPHEQLVADAEADTDVYAGGLCAPIAPDSFSELPDAWADRDTVCIPVQYIHLCNAT